MTAFDPGPPLPGEAADYYVKYINLVPPGSIVETLDAQRESTLAFLQTIPEERAGHRYAEGKWSVRDVLGHINDVERLFTMRAFWFARGLPSSLPSYEQDSVALNAGTGHRTISSYADEFSALRNSTVHLFRHLTPEAWMRNGIASDSPFTVRSLAYIAAGHVQHHLSILGDRYL
jgi:hypothetical protein